MNWDTFIVLLILFDIVCVGLLIRFAIEWVMNK